MTVYECYQWIKQRLQAEGLEGSSGEAMLMIGKVCALHKEDILLGRERQLASEQADKIQAMLEKRLTGYPLQYILGEWEFYGLPFSVGEGVLIPRSDTEILCEAAIQEIQKRQSPTVLDLCSGSGCVAVAVRKHCLDSRVYALEKSEQALSYLRKNADRNQTKLDILQGDVLDMEMANKFPKADVITANPPYLTFGDMQALQKEVSFEPAEALYGDEDGLLFYREITRIWKQALHQGGTLFYEIGAGQDKDVEKILQENGFHSICFWKDYCGIIRVVAGTYV